MFILAIIYLALYYIRPTEWIPGIIGIPLLMVVGVISLFVISAGVSARRYPMVLTGATERMMFGYLAAITLSQVAHFNLSGTVSSLLLLMPVVTGFLLVSCSLDTRKKIGTFILVLIGLTLFLAYEGCLQYKTGIAHGGMQAIFENHLLASGDIEKIPRVRWYGVFNDPNDLGLAMVLTVPFLLNMLMHRRFIVPIVSFPLIAMAIYYTNSRGTVLSGLIAITSYFVIRYRSMYGVFVGGIVAGTLIIFGPSRMATISASEDSAYGRIGAWYEAYQMFKANPLFGVGQGMFIEHHSRTAHNSFVLVMAELGVLGLFFFTGMFYFPYRWLWRNLFRSGLRAVSPEDIGLISASFASLTSMLMAMFFLSRSYILIPFMLVALVMAVIRTLSAETEYVATEKLTQHYCTIMYLTVFQIVVINIIVKMCI